MIKKYKEYIKESVNYDSLNKVVEITFKRLDNILEKEEISYDNLLESIKLIGDGEIKIEKNYRVNYEEKLSDNRILMVWGHISNPVMTRGYDYEIRIVEDVTSTEQFGGGFGSPGVITSSKPTLFSYITGQNVYFNKHIISKVCDEIKNLV